jgi:hypothetical protein
MAAHFVERLLVLVKDPSCHEAVLAKGESHGGRTCWGLGG